MCNLVFMVINEGEAEAVKIIEDRQTDRQTDRKYTCISPNYMAGRPSLKLKITAVTRATQREVLTDL